MRDELNLRALKHSKKRKHRKIYDKVHRIIRMKKETPELSEKEIISISSNYPTLDVAVIMGGSISVKSKNDSWLIMNEGSYYALYHRGTSFKNGKVREHYHIQDVFYDLKYTFLSIVSHDKHKLGLKGWNPYKMGKMVENI
ncbi:hypothetical protein RVS70_05360 [Virgibacillus sp. M23]|uniref:hypothetical protein n=1 Tax=Virgibacillus sp. M23 TaxID=3079030 RepID=UPI002A91D206|nr:hypothetical protein [Virgibacillus sp. M23]MDY7043629.1 hypothetical protein [Virgibacillus sp. M23]